MNCQENTIESISRNMFQLAIIIHSVEVSVFDSSEIIEP